MTTKLRIWNRTDSEVQVWITLGTTPGCLQDISEIPWITAIVNPLVGYFILDPYEVTSEYAPAGLGFNGNISFNTPPLNCCADEFPEGVNIFEFILNNGFQSGAPQETVDISCVAGVHCLIECSLLDGEYANGTWNAGNSVPIVREFSNSVMRENNRVGVFPYGCDVCTGSQNPPCCEACLPFDVPQIENVCNVQRDALLTGGCVEVAYCGEI